MDFFLAMFLGFSAVVSFDKAENSLYNLDVKDSIGNAGDHAEDTMEPAGMYSRH